MASKSPLQKLQDALVETVKGAITHPRDTAAKAGEQAKGTMSLGKAVAGHVTRSAAGVVASRLPGHRSPTGTPGRTPEVDVPRSRAETPAEPSPEGRQPTPTKPPVTDVVTDLVKQQAASRPAAKRAPAPVSPIDAAADAAHVEATPADLAKKATTAQKASAKRTSTKSAAKKAPAKKTPAKSAATPSDRLPARKRVPAPDADQG